MRRWALALLPLLLAAGRADAATGRRRLDVDGVTRSYLLHVPPTLPPGRRLPLLLAFHGAGADAQGLVRATGLDELADREGFVVAYPEAWPARRAFQAGAPAASDGGPDDLRFVTRLLDELARTLPIDPDRVHATGFSNGGMLCHRLAAEMADRIASVAPVSGALGRDVRGPPSRPVPVLLVHGTGDRRVPLAGPGGPTPRYLPFADAMARWIRWDGCTEVGIEERFEPVPGFVVRRDWHGDDGGGAAVVSMLVEGGGHTWPQEAGQWITRSLVAFLLAHPRVVASRTPR